MSYRKRSLWVLNCLNIIRRNGLAEDLAFVGTKEGPYYPVHKPLLTCNSGYFRDLFEDQKGNNFEPIIVDNIDPQALVQCIDYIYSGYVEITEENLDSLLEAAEILQMEDMHKKCINAAIDMLDPDNIIDTLNRAYEVQCERLKEATEVYAQMCFDVFVKHEDFVFLEQSTLRELLKYRKIKTLPERVVYKALMRWIEHDIPSRENLLPQLLELINLDHLPLQYLKSEVYMHNLIKNNAKCRDQVKQTLFKFLHPEMALECQNSLTTAESILLIDKSGKVLAYSPWSQYWRRFVDIPSVKGKFTAVTVNKCIFLITDNKKLFKLDIREKSWLKMADMSDGRGHPRGVSMDGMVYVTGGTVASGSRALRSAERFIPERNEWEKLPSMKKPRSKHTLIVAGGHLYAIAGVNNNGVPTKFVERFDPITKSWENIEPMKQARSGALAVVREKWIYVMGGTGTPDVSVEITMHKLIGWTSLVLSIPKTIVNACVVANDIYILNSSESKGSKQYAIWMLSFYGDQWSPVAEFMTDNEFECLTVL